MLAAVGVDRDEVAGVARSAVTAVGEGAEQLLDVPALCPARRLDAGAAAERGDLDPRVVREHPAPRRPDEAPVARLDARVVEERQAVLLRIVARAEELELPVREERAELVELVRVRGADGGEDYRRRHRTPIT